MSPPAVTISRASARFGKAVTCIDATSPYHRKMAAADALAAWNRLHALAGTQFGLFTATQAGRHGITHHDLSRRAQAGELYRAHRGVYGFSADAEDMCPYADWAGRWLSLRPGADIAARRANPDCIVSHDSAASIRDLGTLPSRGLYLTGPRLVTSSPRIHAYRRDFGAQGLDWELFDGLPVATAGRIIADLAGDRIDGGHLGTVIADVVAEGILTLDQVGARLAPFAHFWSETDGVELALRFAHDAGRRLRVTPA